MSKEDFDSLPESDMAAQLRKRDEQRVRDIASGKIVCDIKDPENCESCSG